MDSGASRKSIPSDLAAHTGHSFIDCYAAVRPVRPDIRRNRETMAAERLSCADEPDFFWSGYRLLQHPRAAAIGQSLPSGSSYQAFSASSQDADQIVATSDCVTGAVAEWRLLDAIACVVKSN